MKEQYKQIKLLLKNKDNRIWFIKTFCKKFGVFFTGFITLWTLLEAFNINLTVFFDGIIPGISIKLMLLVGAGCLVVAIYQSMTELRSYCRIRVETERSGCSVEISVADSYLTNAFVDYPNCAMCIGIAKPFCFQEATPNSLIEDMWKELEKRNISKFQVQEAIDNELKKLWTNPDGTVNEEEKAKYIDPKRPKVKVRWEGEEGGYAIRDNYKIGTMVGVNLKWKETVKDKNDKTKEQEVLRSKKLYVIANSEVVEGEDMSEPLKVIYDKKASVVEHFPMIWEYFDHDEVLNENPPKHRLYAPLLIPLIGAGVANEGYSDVEIFSKIVDLYYENLRKSIREGRQPAIPNLIINIRSNTAIEMGKRESLNGRTIDIKNAFWYLQYRNKINPVVSRESYSLQE